MKLMPDADDFKSAVNLFEHEALLILTPEQMTSIANINLIVDGELEDTLILRTKIENILLLRIGDEFISNTVIYGIIRACLNLTIDLRGSRPNDIDGYAPRPKHYLF